MFNDCPAEIKKMIFARVRLMDLYEVSCVSKEWWALTMATCSPASDEYTCFLEFQVKFCNQMMPKEEGWKPWMFIEFTDDKSLKLFGPPDKKMIEYLRQKEILVLKLVYRSRTSILPNLKKLFPCLLTLDFCSWHAFDYDGKAVLLPEGLKHLRLDINKSHKWPHSRDVLKHLEVLESLYIVIGQRILFGNIRLDKLRHLHLDMSQYSTDDIKSLVTCAMQLSTLYLEYGLVDKEWLGLFPANIMKIHLQNMRLDKAIAPLFGTADAFVERQLMRFICQDWTKIRLFKCSSVSYSFFYDKVYVCRPQALEEELEITIKEGETPSGLLDSGKLQLKALKIIEFRDTKRDLDIIVPKSVQHFEWTADKFEAINFAVLFEDISGIKSLRIRSLFDDKLQFSDFPLAVNLVSLDIWLVDDTLASILRNCPSLKELTLKCPQGMPFSKLPADLISPSVEQLTIIQPKDSVTNILKHFPCLVDLQLQHVNMETITIADLVKLKSLDFVRINFRNAYNLTALILVVNDLHLLSFPHIVLSYSRFEPGRNLSCVMGREKAFFRRYVCSNWRNDFTNMNIKSWDDCYHPQGLSFVKGISSLHMSPRLEFIPITHDLQEFICTCFG